MRRAAFAPALAAALAVAACQPAARAAGGSATAAPAPTAKPAAGGEGLPLPTGVRLDPAGPSFDIGNMPLGIAAAPGGDRLAVLLCGWREEGLQIVDRTTGRVLQTLPQAAAFLGLAFSPDGRTLYASGGNEDVVYRYAWREGKAAAEGTIVLGRKDPKKGGTRYPAGMALSPDGLRLYVAEHLGDALAVVDLSSGKVVQRFPVERLPYGVAVAPDGTVYASSWGGTTVAVFRSAAGGLAASGRIEVGRHPSALLLNAAGSRLFVASATTDRVAVVDTGARRVIAELLDPPPAGPGEGSTPNALALSAAGTRLFVAEADDNAVGVFDLSAATSGVAAAHGADRLDGRIPAQWYPTALLATADSLLVVNGKGRGAGPNPGKPQPGSPRDPASRTYTLGQLNGTLTAVPGGVAGTSGPELADLTRRVARANGWEERPPAKAAGLPPFEHVVYMIKENRTYDQILGDVAAADGDRSLALFPREVSPNHHALAERFGLFDRFFVNAEVSSQGHPWSTSAYVTDFTEKTTPVGYSRRYPEGSEGEEAEQPASGYLWTLALKKGLLVRDYGEGTDPGKGPGGKTIYTSPKPGLGPYVDTAYPGWDLDVRDQVRADRWIGELEEQVRRGRMPALEIVWLPGDHTSGGLPGKRTPRAYVADNDLALGRMIEALSRTPFWKSTLVCVLEDDAQDGPDHVDSHRSVLLVVSAYNRPGRISRFVNTTDVLTTVEQALGLGALSHFDYYGRSLAGLFAATPDLTPYRALRPSVSMDEKNPRRGAAAAQSAKLDLHAPDAADDDLLSRIVWQSVKGDAPFPGPTRMNLLELERGR